MEPTDSSKQERTLKMQSKVLEHLAESGNISYTCKKAGINRDTFYAWKKEDKLFAENATLAVNYGKSFVNDLAHTQLIRLIQDGNMQAVRFQLLSCHDDYKPRRALMPIEPEDEKPEPITQIIIVPAKPRTSTPSPAPSAPPKEEKNKSHPASPATKPSPAPTPEVDDNRFQPPRGRNPFNDDDGFLVDSSWLWGKR